MQPTKEITIELKATKFSYEPNIISVNKGDKVTFVLASEDVEHGLYLDAYELETHALPGEKKSITFTATKTGKFPFRCSITCGNFHPYMIGWLKVGPNYKLITSIWLVIIGSWSALLVALRRGGILQ